VAFPAVLDACVLYPFTLRDTLLRLAELELYEPYWSDRLLDELRRNLVARAIDEQAADRLIEQMLVAFDGATVPEAQIAAIEPSMGNHEKDRHVLAAAKAIGAERIVTKNLKDFPPEACDSLGIEAIHPDEFLLVLYEMAPDAVARAGIAHGPISQRPGTASSKASSGTTGIQGATWIAAPRARAFSW
jgi:predicted nucleic acid-binding protein